jgi:hypothetical protein
MIGKVDWYPNVSHAWNIVKLDGNWYMIDPQVLDRLGSDKDFENLGYTWDKSAYPECSTQLPIECGYRTQIKGDYYYYSDYVMEDEDSGCNLLKVKYDGTDKSTVTTIPQSYINLQIWSLEGDWCYYSCRSNYLNLYRVNIKTNEVEQVAEFDAGDTFDYYIVKNGWVYLKADSRIVRVNVDTKEHQEIFRLNVDENMMNGDEYKVIDEIKFSDHGLDVSVSITKDDIIKIEFYNINYDGTGKTLTDAKTCKP